MKKLSVVIATKNCEKRIQSTILPWKSLAHEIIVVDQFSTDNTAKLAQELGCIVLKNNPPDNNFDINRKLGFLKSTGDWILYIDTDERPTQELISEIKNFLSGHEADIYCGVKIPNEFYFLGKKIKYGIYNKNHSEIRLFRKNAWVYEPEKGFHHGVHVTGDIKKFKSHYKHFNVNSIAEWFIKTNQYTELDSLKQFKNFKFSLFKAIFTSWRFFIKHYFFKFGFLDGVHGFLCVYYFMLYHFTLKAKIFEKQYLAGAKLEEDYLEPLELKLRE
jgi:glycosyltransferase involved in cell wall biosynthesis